MPAAKLESQLTKGDFEVGDVYSVDPKRKVVAYASNESDLLEQQIWQVSFDGDRKPLSAGAGFRQAAFAPDGKSLHRQVLHPHDAAGTARLHCREVRLVPRVLADARAGRVPFARAAAA